MKPLIVFHDNCADGFGAAFAAFAAWLKFGDEAEYVPMSYGEKLLGHNFLTDAIQDAAVASDVFTEVEVFGGAHDRNLR